MSAGKGDTPRKVNGDKFRANYLRIFQEKPKQDHGSNEVQILNRNAQRGNRSSVNTESGGRQGNPSSELDANRLG